MSVFVVDCVSTEQAKQPKQLSAHAGQLHLPYVNRLLSMLLPLHNKQNPASTLQVMEAVEGNRVLEHILMRNKVLDGDNYVLHVQVCDFFTTTRV